MSALQIHTVTLLMKVDNKHLIPWGQWILFPSNLNVSLDFVLGNIDIQAKQNSLFPKGLVIKLFVAKENKGRKSVLRFEWQQHANFNGMLRSRVAAVKVSRVTVNYFPFYVIVFAIVAACGIWRWTVSQSDVMWPWTSQWMGEPWREEHQLYKKVC